MALLLSVGSALCACESSYGPVVRGIRPLGGGKLEVESCYLRGEGFGQRALAGFSKCSRKVLDVNAPPPPPSAAAAAASDKAWND